MNRKERLLATFRGEPVDRVPVRLWNVNPCRDLLHPDYEPVHRLAVERSDLMVGSGSEFDLHSGLHREDVVHTEERPTESEEWVNLITTIETPEGPLQSVYRKSTCKKPGYDMEPFLKEPEDIKRLLSVTYEPFPFSEVEFRRTESVIGDAGIVMFGLDHAMYGLTRMMGSENFALWSFDHSGLMLEAIEVYAQRIQEQVKRAFEAGIQTVFGWVGPELCIPPLMSPRAFDEYVLPFDKALCDLIHEGGGHAWVHCHGKMGPVLERFVDMGTDVLNPVEPPPMGDVTLEEAFQVVGSEMGLEGNIQSHDLMTGNREILEAKIHEAIDAGSRDGRRFILCPCSGYMEVPEPSKQLIDNLLFYVEEGVRYAEKCG